MRINLPLKYSCSRPVIEVLLNGFSVPALVDTGAEVPVVLLDQSTCKTYKMEFVDSGHKLSGFGGDGELCDRYRATINVGNIVYPNLSFLRHSSSRSFYLILPASMFSEFVLTIDNIGQEFILENNSNQLCYNVTVKDESGNSAVLGNSFNEAMKLLSGGFK